MLTTRPQIPPHGRWRHLDAGIPRVQPLIEKWNSSNSPPDQKEITKRLLDLFLVSVLLDAGAGNQWVYDDVASGQKFGRSEGLGVASINMFAEGFFSGDSQQPYKVNGTSSLHAVLSSFLLSARELTCGAGRMPYSVELHDLECSRHIIAPHL